MNAENGTLWRSLLARHSELRGRKWLGYMEEEELEWIESRLQKFEEDDDA